MTETGIDWATAEGTGQSLPQLLLLHSGDTRGQIVLYCGPCSALCEILSTCLSVGAKIKYKVSGL